MSTTSKFLVSCVLGVQVMLTGGQPNLNQIAYQHAANPGAPPAPPAQPSPVTLVPPAAQPPVTPGAGPQAPQPPQPPQAPAGPQPATPSAPGGLPPPAGPQTGAPPAAGPPVYTRPVMMGSNIMMNCADPMEFGSCAGKAFRVVNPSNLWALHCEQAGSCAGMQLDLNFAPGYFVDQIEGFHFEAAGAARGTTIRVNAPYWMEIGTIECREQGACAGLTIEVGPGTDLYNMNMECRNQGCFGCTIKQGNMRMPCQQLSQNSGNQQMPFMPAPWSPTAPQMGPYGPQQAPPQQWAPQQAPPQQQWAQPITPPAQAQPQPQYGPYGQQFGQQYNPYAQYNPQFNPYI